MRLIEQVFGGIDMRSILVCNSWTTFEGAR